MFKVIFTVLFTVASVVMTGCGDVRKVNKMSDEEVDQYARELSRRFILVDTHIDWPDALRERKFTVGITSNDTLIRSHQGEFDFERAKAGGLDAAFMSIYIPVSYQNRPDNGRALADSLINTVIGMTKQLPDKFAMAASPGDVERNARTGRISLPMGMENGAPIGSDLKNLKYFFDRGIRYITLTHNKDNQICDSSRDSTHTWNGLSPFGRDVVKEMNRLGIMVDVSHVDDSTFFQVIKLSKAPVLASHSSCRYFAPSVSRNMSDEMIRALGQQGGVVMINFYTDFLDSLAGKDDALLKQHLADKGLKATDSEAIRQFRLDHPLMVNVETVANHIDHVASVAGLDHVGIGSDFDGVQGHLPVGLEDASKYPNLICELLKRGYTEQDIEKVCYGNIFRVWSKTADIASRMQAAN